jgi:hypothetical protein
MLPQRPAISLGEARKILGKEANGLNDADLLQVINTLTLLAREHLDRANPHPTKSIVRSNRKKDYNDGKQE